jgi:hypothetical protein
MHTEMFVGGGEPPRRISPDCLTKQIQMNEVIASIDLKHNDISADCSNVFFLGVKIIEKEYKTSIPCNICLDAQNNRAQLILLNIPQQQWFIDTDLRDTIVYKLTTHLRMCLDHFDADLPLAHSLNQ